MMGAGILGAVLGAVAMPSEFLHARRRRRIEREARAAYWTKKAFNARVDRAMRNACAGLGPKEWSPRGLRGVVWPK